MAKINIEITDGFVNNMFYGTMVVIFISPLVALLLNYIFGAR